MVEIVVLFLTRWPKYSNFLLVAVFATSIFRFSADKSLVGLQGSFLYPHTHSCPEWAKGATYPITIIHFYL